VAVVYAARCCHGVPQYGNEGHLSLERLADVDAKRGDEAPSSSMIRTESSRSRRAKKNGGGSTAFEVKPSGEMKYHADPSRTVAHAASTMDALAKTGAAEGVNQSVGSDIVAVAISSADAKKDEATAPDAFGADDPLSASASSGVLLNDHANSTLQADLSALPSEKLSLLQGGQESAFPVQDASKEEPQAMDGAPRTEQRQLPGEGLIGDLLQEGVQVKNDERAGAEEGGAQFPIPGMGNVGDLAFRAMDMMLGTTGIIAEDYPFACICNAYGTCERDVQNTPCPRRAGQMAAARRSVNGGGGASFLLLATAVFALHFFSSC